LRGDLRANAQWIGPSQGTIIHGDPDFDRPENPRPASIPGPREWSRCRMSIAFGDDAAITAILACASG